MNFSTWLQNNQWLENFKILLSINYLIENVSPSWPESVAQEVISTNKFKEWLNSLGIKGKIGSPMTGSVGRAYPIGNYIIKFTTDEHEASAAVMLKGYQSDSLATILDVKLVKTFETLIGKKSLYAIIQEKINTDISKKHRIAGQAIYDYLDNHAGFIQTINLPAILHFVKPKYKNDPDISRLIVQLATSLKKIQDDKGVLSQDTHGGNLGLKNKNPAIFDLGRSSIDYENPSTSNVVRKL